MALAVPLNTDSMTFRNWAHDPNGNGANSTGAFPGFPRQRIATKFLIISYKNVPVGKRGSGPGEFIFKQWRRGINQMRAPKLPISGRGELRPNKVALIRKKKHRRSVRYQVDTGSLSQDRDDVGLPHFTP